MSLVLHERDELRLERLIQDLPQTLIVSAPVGFGDFAVAQAIAERLHVHALLIEPLKDGKVDTEKGSIAVEAIRDIYESVRSKSDTQRVIIVRDAHTMGIPAQNAFLKLLEEPGLNTHFILATASPHQLLPTVRSRAQLFELEPVSQAQSIEILKKEGIHDSQKQAQLLFLALGLPEELKSLSNDEARFAQRSTIVRDARSFLQGSLYDRYLISNTYRDDRNGALLLLNDCMKLLERSIREGKVTLVPKIAGFLEAYERIQANGSVRLQLATVMV